MPKFSQKTWILLTIVYMSGILFMSLQPGADLKSPHSVIIEYVKNFLHFPVYGGLGFLLMRSFSSAEWPAQLYSFLIAVGFGILNEFVQAVVPYRYYSVDDMIVNALGAGIVILLIGKGGWKIENRG